MSDSVQVVDRFRRVLSYTHPAKARKLIKDGRARIVCENPFTIQMEVSMDLVTNFTEYFKEERDVYVQNLTDKQISLEFDIGNGRKESCPIPRTRKPFNLTQMIPFSAIKASTDLRKLVNRTPPALKLLTEGEFQAYYESTARDNGTTVDEELYRAMELRQALVNRQKMPASAEAEVAPVEPELTPDDVLTPRVVGLCSQVGEDIPESERLSARDFVEELEAIETALTSADLEYLVGHGFHKSVKKWVQKRIDDRLNSPKKSA